MHAAQLAALGEELDNQLVKTEIKAKAEARLEAQKQMESERKKIAVEMENKLGELSSQMRTYEKACVELRNSKLKSCKMAIAIWCHMDGNFTFAG